MTALALLALAPVVMWLGQSALLLAHGLPIRWRLDADGAPPAVRAGGRALTQATLLGILLAYPPLIGRGILEYYGSLLPRDSAGQFCCGLAASALFLCVLFGVWLATDQMRVEVHHARRKWMRRLALLPATALFGAFVEELLFRGVVLADLLKSPMMNRWGAIVIGACLFAGAHYVRAVKRYWTIYGHVLLGVLLCMAFVRTGSLWLAAGLHAGGILLIMGARPFVRYRGPAWLVGASIFPFAGLPGMMGLGMLAAWVWWGK